MTQYWAKMHMKSDSAAESVRPAKSQGPAGAYWESLVKLPFGGAFARQRPTLTAPRSSFLRKADSRKPTAALTVPLSH